MTDKRCRFCDASLRHSFVDLGMSPLANSYLTQDQLHQMEPFYPLHPYVCSECLLVQLEAFEAPDHIFGDYAYFSSYSDSWLQHGEKYTDMIVARLGLDGESQVVEIGSNDGYLLQHFQQRDVRVLGIDPAANVAQVANERGIPTLVRFFGRQTARELVGDGVRADLIVGNNVLAHVPDLNDFVAGIQILLHAEGVVTIEFPHLMRLMAGNQFDTIYHEHFSYFSFLTVEQVFAAHGMVLFDVEELPTHGGSLRIYARHAGAVTFPVSSAVKDLRARERRRGMDSLAYYLSFASQVHETKRNLLSFLIAARQGDRSIVGYGAPAKGNTLLNYCGTRTDFIEYTVDRSPHKQGRYLPGTHIPIFSPDRIAETRPDYVLILPWNLREEIMGQMDQVRSWGGRFVVPIPEVKVYP